MRSRRSPAEESLVLYRATWFVNGALLRRTPLALVPAVFDQQQWGWGYQILPYMEQQALWNNTSDQVVAGTPLPLYFCPTRRRPVALSGGILAVATLPHRHVRLRRKRGNRLRFGGGPYIGTGVDGVVMQLGSGTCNAADITDGISNTIMVGEKLLNANFVMTSEPNDNDGYVAGFEDDTVRWGSWDSGNANDPNNVGPPIADFYGPAWTFSNLMPNNYRFGSAHAGGANFVFCDGTVRLIHYSVNPETFRRACCRNDGLTFSTDAL